MDPLSSTTQPIGDYAAAVEYLYSNLPMFQRVGPAALKIDLTNTIRLCEALGNPQDKLKFIHVAGTNGKGSTAHMLAAILQSAGYRTGLYTSPHLKAFTERIRVDGQEAETDYVVDFVNRLHPIIQEVKPSFFELTVAMAFDYFVTKKVVIAVMETGLGGRLDSTNIIIPDLSVITNIGKDHAELLGNTLEKIAYEKAGIIKSYVPVVVSERQTAVAHVFQQVADRHQAPIYFGSDRYKIMTDVEGDTLTVLCDNEPILTALNLPLKGYYQHRNMIGVMSAVEHLRHLGYKLEESAVRKGLENVVTLTGLKGRWQKLQENPLMVCDTAHNAEGLREVIRQISEIPFEKLHMVLGVVADKDLTEVLTLLPESAQYYFCQASLPRALPAEALEARAREAGLQGVVIPNVMDAIRQAKENAGSEDLIYIGGSTFVVAEIENL